MSDTPTLAAVATPSGQPISDASLVERVTGHQELIIDAMRGFAALLVAYFHCRQIAWVGIQQFHHMFGFSWEPHVIVGYLTLPFSWGSVGVPIFFVISGYCIHRKGAIRLAANPRYQLDARLFWSRRFVRIYPVLIAALIITYLLDAISLHFSPTSHKIHDTSLYTFIINLLSLQGMAAGPYGSNGALWTLSIEVQLYAVYPLLFAARRRFGILNVLIAVLFINVLSAYFLERNNLQFFTSYWFSWTLGAYIAELHAKPNTFACNKRQTMQWRIAALCITALGCGVYHLGHYVAFQLWALGFACYLHTALERVPTLTVMTRAFIRLGTFSYSFYLLHLPVFVCLQAIFFQGVQQPMIWPTFFFMAIAIGAGYVLYRCVEKPAIRWSTHLQRQHAYESNSNNTA